MKKLLLLLCLIFSMHSYSQFNIMNHCGELNFNLTVYQSLLAGNQNPSDLVITYHVLQSDAEANSNPIEHPENYNAGYWIIYARVENTVTSTVTISTITLTVMPMMTVTIQQTLTFPTQQLFVTVAGGQAPYNYVWQVNGAPIGQPAIDGSIYIGNNPSGGTYQVIVTDAYGCMMTTSVAIAPWEYLSAHNDVVSFAASADQNMVSSVSVLSNDMYFGTPANSPNNFPSLTITGIEMPPGFLLNADGTITILAGTPAGTYNLQYSLCETNGNACSNGFATINVITEGFVLNAFVDTNANGIQDPGEHNFPLGQFHYEVNNSGTVTDVFSYSGNCYIQESNPANSYNISFTIDSLYQNQYTINPASYNNVTFSGTGVTAYNFALAVIPYSDLEVNLTNFVAPPRPGFIYRNNIIYRNNGSQVASGTINFTKDNALAITSTSETTAAINPSGFTFDFTNLQPNETRVIVVFMQIPTIPTIALGDLLTNSATVTILSDELSETNNTSTLIQPIVGSYDPNDKSESHGGKIVQSTFTSADYLTYTIRFENTGTANAENVRVQDVLDSQIDETTVKMVDASFPCRLTRTGHNLNWNFNGIALPPSQGNESVGHGYLTFQVKPKPGYAVGDVIPNSASIYFDFNPAIVTAPCTTEFVQTLAVNDFASGAFSYSPNPVRDLLHLANAIPIEKVTVISALGQTILQKTLRSVTTDLDFSSLSAGIYLVKVSAGAQEQVFKIVKE